MALTLNTAHDVPWFDQVPGPQRQFVYCGAQAPVPTALCESPSPPAQLVAHCVKAWPLHTVLESGAHTRSDLCVCMHVPVLGLHVCVLQSSPSSHDAAEVPVPEHVPQPFVGVIAAPHATVLAAGQAGVHCATQLLVSADQVPLA